MDLVVKIPSKVSYQPLYVHVYGKETLFAMFNCKSETYKPNAEISLNAKNLNNLFKS